MTDKLNKFLALYENTKDKKVYQLHKDYKKFKKDELLSDRRQFIVNEFYHPKKSK